MLKKMNTNNNHNNNDYRDDRTWCCLHPQELVIGVCALCLNERLLVLASKQRYHHIHQRNNKIYGNISTKRALPKIFALTSLLNRLDIKQQRPAEVYEISSSTSQEDSFISIKFEENGVASWDKGGKTSKMSLDDHQSETSPNHKINNLDKAEKIKTVIEHTKRQSSMRWRKRIGHLFQLVKGKRSSNKGNIKLHEGSKIKYGWMRSITKRKTKA